MRHTTFAIALSLLTGALLGALIQSQQLPGLVFVGALAFGCVLFTLIAQLEVR